jgi:hypothetical protein
MVGYRMTAPFLAQGMPANESWFGDQIRSLQRQITELRAAQTLNAASVGAGGISSSNFDGSLDPPAVGTQGWGLAGGPNGAAIVGTLYVRDAIIGDAALSSPVAPAILDGTSTGLTFTGSPVTYHTESISVPDGFSQALVFATATAGMICTAAGSSGIVAQAQIGATVGDTIESNCQASSFMSVSAPFALLVAGLPSDGTGTLTVAARAEASSPAAMSAGTGNVHISATALFLR